MTGEPVMEMVLGDKNQVGRIWRIGTGADRLVGEFFLRQWSRVADLDGEEMR